METIFRRFFKRLPSQQADAQIQESLKREEILKRLHGVENQLTDIVSQIKCELHETVTQDGIPISEKLKFEYSELVKRIEREREGSSPFSPKRPSTAF